jgi:hypothetical protein
LSWTSGLMSRAVFAGNKVCAEIPVTLSRSKRAAIDMCRVFMFLACILPQAAKDWSASLLACNEREARTEKRASEDAGAPVKPRALVAPTTLRITGHFSATSADDCRVLFDTAAAFGIQSNRALTNPPSSTRRA